MTGVFNDIELEWQDRIYTIKSHRVMGAIYKIEDVITLQEFQDYASKGTAPIAKLCGAYGAVLRYAGANVKDEDVYDLAFQSDDQQELIMIAIMNLITMMLPPSARAKLELMDTETGGEGANLGNRKATTSGSSNPRSRRRSQKRNG